MSYGVRYARIEAHNGHPLQISQLAVIDIHGNNVAYHKSVRATAHQGTSGPSYAVDGYLFCNRDVVQGIYLSNSSTGSYFEVDLGASFDIGSVIYVDRSGFTTQPTGQPSALPSGEPTYIPTGQPSSIPSGRPSSTPSFPPTSVPSGQPSGQPTGKPRVFISNAPSSIPSGVPAILPSSKPSLFYPSSQPSSIPSGQPSSIPSGQPSSTPVRPMWYPTSPTGIPTGRPLTPRPTSVRTRSIGYRVSLYDMYHTSEVASWVIHTDECPMNLFPAGSSPGPTFGEFVF